jgi:hypothetical protein
VEKCLLEFLEACPTLVEDVRAGPEHDVVRINFAIERNVDEGAQGLDVKAEIVDLATQGVHTRFCVEQTAIKPSVGGRAFRDASAPGVVDARVDAVSAVADFGGMG